MQLTDVTSSQLSKLAFHFQILELFTKQIHEINPKNVLFSNEDFQTAIYTSCLKIQNKIFHVIKLGFYYFDRPLL